MTIFYRNMGLPFVEEKRSSAASNKTEFLSGLDISELVVGNMYRVYVKNPNASDLREGVIEVLCISIIDNTIDGNFQFYDGMRFNPILPTRLRLEEYSVFPMIG